MKICYAICEYNPLHLGHIKHIRYVKDVLKAENLVVIMSGNFTQRGEPAVLDKFTRSEHAIKAGADLVIELPTVFATANAETFSKGAINIIDSLNNGEGLCFGAEEDDKNKFLALAKEMNNESKDFKKALKENLSSGIGLAKAKFLALKSLGNSELDESLISLPNNTLGLEYTKALLSLNSNIEIFPLKRDEGHNDLTLKKGITSSSSIRIALDSGKIKKLKKSLPEFVYDDLNQTRAPFNAIIMSKLLTTSAKDLSLCPDCTEGLENRIKALSKDNLSLSTLISKVSTKRYTEARIRRILTANLLGITQNLLDDCLNSPLYAKVLAVKKDKKSLISELSKTASIPLLTRKSDLSSLKKTAEKCFQVDVLANDLYNLACGKTQNENQMLII